MQTPLGAIIGAAVNVIVFAVAATFVVNFIVAVYGIEMHKSLRQTDAKIQTPLGAIVGVIVNVVVVAVADMVFVSMGIATGVIIVVAIADAIADAIAARTFAISMRGVDANLATAHYSTTATVN